MTFLHVSCLHRTEACLMYVFAWLINRQNVQSCRAFEHLATCGIYRLFLQKPAKAHQVARSTTTAAVCKNTVVNNRIEAPLAAEKVTGVIIPWATGAHMNRSNTNTTAWKHWNKRTILLFAWMFVSFESQLLQHLYRQPVQYCISKHQMYFPELTFSLLKHCKFRVAIATSRLSTNSLELIVK